MGSETYAYYDSLFKTADYAAKLCNDYEVGAYDDWFLPSKDELNLMYDNLKTQGLGGFVDYLFWSSSEGDADKAWTQNFSSDSGFQDNRNRYDGGRVRPIRAF